MLTKCTFRCWTWYPLHVLHFRDISCLTPYTSLNADNTVWQEEQHQRSAAENRGIPVSSNQNQMAWSTLFCSVLVTCILLQDDVMARHKTAFDRIAAINSKYGECELHARPKTDRGWCAILYKHGQLWLFYFDLWFWFQNQLFSANWQKNPMFLLSFRNAISHTDQVTNLFC